MASSASTEAEGLNQNLYARRRTARTGMVRRMHAVCKIRWNSESKFCSVREQGSEFDSQPVSRTQRIGTLQMDCTDYYRSLHQKAGMVLEHLDGTDEAKLQSESHLALSDLDAWIDAIATRPESAVLRRAATEYQIALFLVSIGQYKPAFTCLRSALEIGLVTIAHSASILHHKEWIQGRRDIYWDALISPSDGVLSKNFCTVFFHELGDEISHINTLAKSTYRSCSEYVHGNPSMDGKIPPPFHFSQQAFNHFHELAKSSRYVLFFALSMRYLMELDQKGRSRVEQCLIDNLVHLAPIQQTLHRSSGDT